MKSIKSFAEHPVYSVAQYWYPGSKLVHNQSSIYLPFIAREPRTRFTGTYFVKTSPRHIWDKAAVKWQHNWKYFYLNSFEHKILFLLSGTSLCHVQIQSVNACSLVQYLFTCSQLLQFTIFRRCHLKECIFRIFDRSQTQQSKSDNRCSDLCGDIVNKIVNTK